MVVLADREIPSKELLLAALAGQNINALESRQGVVSFLLDTIQINCGLVAAPIPKGELKGPLTTSPYWKEDDQKVLAHKAHLIVAASGEVEKKVLALVLTKAISGVLKSTATSVAVYWGAGSVVTQKDIFCCFADSATIDQLPLYLWIDFRCHRSGDVVALFTNGMKSFGLMEIEISRSTYSAKETVGTAFNIAHYLLDFGPVLKNGDTIGLSAEQKLKITHTNSNYDRDEIIYHLDLER